jgi:hypothetical protein
VSDMSPEDVAAFDSAHERLLALKGHSDVQALVAKLVAGILPFKQFLGDLFALPSVQGLVLSIDAGAAKGIGALVAAETPPPFGFVTGPGAAALVQLGLDAIAHHLLPATSGTSPAAAP